ncbi:hypothetical protein R1flu_023030 [Riccia fluitans]|uniref:BTB domain-containing protein n=1 Tax=Riccia fluitans TaxID=41844 RepID=A0ABD1XUY4_9MARC
MFTNQAVDPSRCRLDSWDSVPGTWVSIDVLLAVDLCEKEKRLEFLSAYESNPLSKDFRGDVRLVGYDQEPVFAHRIILAGKSQVFKRMFENDMEEKETGIVQIDDASIPVLRSNVKYCYTADISFTTETSVEELLKIDHKYCIGNLKTLCDEVLSRTINEDNICDRMVLAEIYEVKKLEGNLNRFYSENLDKLNIYSLVAKRLCTRFSG